MCGQELCGMEGRNATRNTGSERKMVGVEEERTIKEDLRPDQFS
jgi:hypothetical protein